MARVRTPTSPRVFLDLVDVAFHLVHEGAELGEFGFCALQDLPYFVAFFLEGEHVETHAIAGEDHEQGAGADDGDVALGLDLGLESVSAHYLGVEAFGREEHQGEGGGGGRVDVFGADGFCLLADGGFEGFAGLLQLVGVVGV